MQAHGRVDGLRLGALLAVVVCAREAGAWTHPEHRDIAGAAIERLDPSRRERLDSLWAEARRGHEARLCESAWAPHGGSAGISGKGAPCLDFTAWSAFAGDHSCSADDLLATVLESSWALPVERVSEELHRRFASARRSSDRLNALAWSNLRLETTDPGYSSRATANNAHFLLARQGGEDVRAYLERALAPGTELNAAGIFAVEHERALDLSRALAGPGGAAPAEPPSRAREIGEPAPGERTARALRILAAEAYALHFLEDVFAAGHVAGTWGDVADRKGTHDYYNENGLEVVTWSGERTVLLGDAWMRPEDLAGAARVVRLSLEQVLDALGEPPALASTARTPVETCRAAGEPAIAPGSLDAERVAIILAQTPVPGRASGLGELPRFRSEIGLFLGVAGSGALAGSAGSSSEKDGHLRGSGTLSIGLRVGLGIDSLIGQSGDGLAFVEGGLLQQTRQDVGCSVCSSEGLLGYVPGIPGRSALHLRLRLPFWAVPGDLLLAVPLALIDSDLYKRMAIRAANGGVLGIESGLATRFGRFQLVLGREVGATFFGYVGGDDRFLTPVVQPDGRIEGQALAYRSIRIEAPVVEYRPFREFATRQAFTVLAQIGAGFDVPTSLKVATAEGEVRVPAGKSLGFVYARVAFDWRRYF